MKPTVYFASDHAGFSLKAELLNFVRNDLQYPVVDCGATTLDLTDDYPDFIARAAAAVSRQPTDRAIILGGSGQGEAMVANRFPGVRAAVFYGEPELSQVDAAGDTLSLIASSRVHNDANVLSLGARFLTAETARNAVKIWLQTSFSNEERHIRRIKKLEQLQR